MWVAGPVDEDQGSAASRHYISDMDTSGTTATSLRSRMRGAEVLSTVGAAVLGAGIALMFADALRAIAWQAALLGGISHAAGMLLRHRLDATQPVIRAQWETPLYWACWVGLAALFAWAILA